MPLHHIRHITGFLVILFLVGIHQQVACQITEVQARELLAQRGIPEDTLRNRLLKKGFDPDRIRPDQTAAFQTALLETIREIEEDIPGNVSQPNVKIETTNTVPSPAAQDVGIETRPELKFDPDFKKVAIYGQEIFRNNSIGFYQKVDEIAPSDSYIIGVGDKIGVISFGRSQFEQVLDVGVDGFVRPSQPGGLPKILVKGLSFGDAKELLFKRYEQYTVITRDQFQVTLVKPRNITVNVFGEAKTTGGFSLPAFNTAFNVISAAGGPTDIGSVRRIKVISGTNVRPLDVYEFMNDPSVAKNFFLQDNDYIHIPVAEKVIKITGAITRPMAYELLDKENLSHLIRYAGGILPNGYLSDVQVTRFLEDRQVVTNINFRALIDSGGDYILYNGDEVEIKTIEENVLNFVSVTGAIQFPGRYERRPGMKISDLLAQSKLRADARLDFAYLLRYQPDNTYQYLRINLQPIVENPTSAENLILGDQDALNVVALKSYADLSYFSVTGAVRNPDEFVFNPNGVLKLEDAILLAGGLSIEAADNGYIVRSDPKEPKTIEYIHVDLRKAFDDPVSDANVEIKPGDQIVVYNKGKIRDNLTVEIFGAVRDAGSYAYGPDMTLADLVNLAGGFTFSADRDRIDIARLEFSQVQDLKITQYTTQLPADFSLNQASDNSFPLRPFDHIYIREIPEFELQQTVIITGEVKYPGFYTILQDKERISDLIRRAGGLTGGAFAEGAKLYRVGDSTGLVVINLHEILENENEPSNVALLSRDVINIPKSRDLVTIGGFVNLDDAYSHGFLLGENSISVAFRGEKSAKYYIDNFAAGVSEAGASSEIKVQFADGRMQKTKHFLFFKQYPKAKRGAIITVGAKKEKPVREKTREDIDWSSVVRDTLAQATAVFTILLLVDQLRK